jgi:uncharacterized protein (DUF1330 family)
MSVYVVAQLTFIDRKAYARYQSRFMEVISQFRGKVLAADERPDILEGSWLQDKLVLLAFPDRQAFSEWSESPAYQEILKDRKTGAHATVLLVKGIESRSERTIEFKMHSHLL